MASEPVKIAVVIEGGVVTSILSAGLPVDVVIVDYDIDGAERAHFIHPGDKTERANIYRECVDYSDPAFVLEALAAAELEPPPMESEGAPCPACGGKGAFPATGEDCGACRGGGVTLPLSQRPTLAEIEAVALRRRDDVAAVDILPGGRFSTQDDVGDIFEGDYAGTLAWLDAGLEPDECATCAAATETRLMPCDECGARDEESEGETLPPDESTYPDDRAWIEAKRQAAGECIRCGADLIGGECPDKECEANTQSE